MPIYEYRCPECDERFEKLVRTSGSQAEVVCPSCGSARAQRLVSSFASLSSGGSFGGSSASCAPSGGG